MGVAQAGDRRQVRKGSLSWRCLPRFVDNSVKAPFIRKRCSLYTASFSFGIVEDRQDFGGVPPTRLMMYHLSSQAGGTPHERLLPMRRR